MGVLGPFGVSGVWGMSGVYWGLAGSVGTQEPEVVWVAFGVPRGSWGCQGPLGQHQGFRGVGGVKGILGGWQEV